MLTPASESLPGDPPRSPIYGKLDQDWYLEVFSIWTFPSRLTFILQKPQSGRLVSCFLISLPAGRPPPGVRGHALGHQLPPSFPDPPANA